MPSNLRLAVLVDPLTVRMKGGDHAEGLSREFRRRGHVLELFGAPADWAAESRPVADNSKSVIGFQPDAIIAYDSLSPAAWLGARSARRLKVPLILVEAGVFARGTLFERSLWRIGHSLWGAYVRRATARLIALDPVARDQSIREGFSPARCGVILHGVDLERYRPGRSCQVVARHRIAGRVMACSAALDARSGVDVLIDAFARTLGQRSDWSLVVAGSGAQRARLRAAADRQGIGSRVHFVQDLVADELAGLFSASTLVAEPTLDHNRGLLQVLQAMASGVPIVASDLPRLAHAVNAAECGLLATAGDVASWTAALSRIAFAPELRSRWGANGLRQAEERLGWSRVADGFEAAILAARGEARGGEWSLAS